MGGVTRSTRRSRDEGVRRAEILDAAIDRFGRNGYENTKWADIADDVGIGPTALYHYFDSKQHCLYVILDQALGELHERFDTITADSRRSPRRAARGVRRLLRALRAGGPAQPRPRRRAGAPERQELLPARRAGSRWPAATRRARSRSPGPVSSPTRCAQGAIPERDPRMLARAILGLYNSIWHWYRPDQTLLLPTLAEFFTARMLAVAGVPPDGATPAARRRVRATARDALRTRAVTPAGAAGAHRPGVPVPSGPPAPSCSATTS